MISWASDGKDFYRTTINIEAPRGEAAGRNRARDRSDMRHGGAEGLSKKC